MGLTGPSGSAAAGAGCDEARMPVLVVVCPDRLSRKLAWQQAKPAVDTGETYFDMLCRLYASGSGRRR